MRERHNRALQTVEAAARRLLADLDDGERLSDGWRNERLGQLLVDAAADCCLATLGTLGMSGREIAPYSHRLWQIAGRRIRVGNLQYHAYAKPRGYAGDYLLLGKMLDLFECDDPLGRLFDRYYHKQAAPIAVRLRTSVIAQRAAVAFFGDRRPSTASPPFKAHGSQPAGHRSSRPPRERFRYLSLAAGPARDVRLFLESLGPDAQQDAEVWLADFDPEALEFARASLTELLPAERVHAIAGNPTRAAARLGRALPAMDFIATGGLGDYLDDEQMLRLFADLRAGLAPGGRMLVGNFAEGLPTRPYMEWIAQWFLTYRTPARLESLAEQAGIGDCRRLAEPTGHFSFVEATRDAQ